MLFRYDDITRVHAELSSFCNAACPLCARNHRGGARQMGFTPAQVSLADFVSWFPPELASRISHWDFCGSLGDPCTAKDAIRIVAYVREANPCCSVHLNTNGGMRTAGFWRELAGVFAGSHRGEVVFSIDGLSDTNHLYRRNVEWDKVMENAVAFIGAGGRAVWEYLIFRHNEHQLKEAAALAARMGFAHFVPKKALGLEEGPRPVYGKDGKLQYLISPPRDPANRNDRASCGDFDLRSLKSELDFGGAERRFREALRDFDPADYPARRSDELTRLERAPIRCKSIRREGEREVFDIYVNSAGQVFPCCYTGTAFVSSTDNYAYLQLQKRIREVGLDRRTLRTHTLKELLSEGHLDRAFAGSWEKETFAKGRLAYCAETCTPGSAMDGVFSHKDDTRTATRGTIVVDGLPVR